MKNILILFLFLISGHSIWAQKMTQKIPISIGYFSFLGIQPGAKIGTHFNWRSWKKEGAHSTWHKYLFVRPQLGFYTNPNIHTSYLVNVDFGYKREKSLRRSYFAWSIGLGYLNQAQIAAWRVNLSDGSKEKIRENWAWFLPTLNYEFGKAFHERMAWYTKFSYGLKMAPSRGSASVFFIELGGHFKLF